MAKELCVFCGKELGTFSNGTVECGPTIQSACRECVRDLKGASDEEKCRRALRLGLAAGTQKLEEQVALYTQAEEVRPACLRCGTMLVFEELITIDITPHGGGGGKFYPVYPAHCSNCGKLEFYHQDYIWQHPLLLQLIKRDTDPANRKG